MAKRKELHQQRLRPGTPVAVGYDTAPAEGDPKDWGGYAQLFNRIIDSNIFAHLSYAARAAYPILVRHANCRDRFSVTIGFGTLAAKAGLSRSQAQEAVDEMVEKRVIEVVRQGHRNDQGVYESNIYRLLVPAEGFVDRSPVPKRGAGGVPPERPGVYRPEGIRSTARPVHASTLRAVGGSAGGTAGGVPPGRSHYRRADQTEGSSTAADNPAAALLVERGGVDPAAARSLADAFPADRILDAVETMEYRRSRGECDNPGGFVRKALQKGYRVPAAVTRARATAAARAKREVAERGERAGMEAEATRAANEEQFIDGLIAAMADDELEMLADSVREKYAGNTAVLKVLNSKPVRQCRLMKMEIAALLRAKPC